MIVLAAITLLTAMATDFAYTTNVNYHLALNEQEKFQAELLAVSAIKLMELELKLEKQYRSNVSGSSAAGMISENLSIPLCQQFPLSTSLIRSMFVGETAEEAKTEGENEEAEGGEGGAEQGSPAHFIGGLQVEAAKEFLDFEGDFQGTCEDESAKFNLNMFAGKDPLQEVLSGLNIFDKSKQMLVSILSRPEYKKLFPENDDKKINEIARNIADWIDINDRINEIGRSSTGSEDSLYPSGKIEYNVKNAKFLTLDELNLVADVTDDWFLPIKNRFTVYGGDKVNVCIAEDEIVAALILQYVVSNPAIPPVNSNDKKRMDELVAVVKDGCAGVQPDVGNIASALDTALGVAAGGAQQTTGESTEETGESRAPEASSRFADMITTETRYYSMVGTGTVGNTEVKVRAILDTQDAAPRRWKFVYWKVE